VHLRKSPVFRFRKFGQFQLTTIQGAAYIPRIGAPSAIGAMTRL